MPGAQVGITQGAAGGKFNVIDHRGYGASSYNKCATTTPDFGAAVYYTGKNIVSTASGNVGATAKYAGFCDPKVISDFTGLAIYVHGELAAMTTDYVAVWNVGRYRVALVKGVVADGALVYPSVTPGYLTATQTGADTAFGIAREGNGGVSDGSIVVEINLLGA